MLVAAFAGYVILRPALDEVVPHLTIVEFPIAIIAASIVARRALRARARPTQLPSLPRRHTQVVRKLPDPETARTRGLFAAWVAHGHHADEVARLLAVVLGRAPGPLELDARTPRQRARRLRHLLSRDHEPGA